MKAMFSKQNRFFLMHSFEKKFKYEFRALSWLKNENGCLHKACYINC